ncbi:response regulator transcription factor [Paraburkholderia atlantica]|uniref:response regulator transcription factor n=1 Tax=Paraburkholderia atlantica TaxID=2654982 RepID=UPI0016085768|nr:response regulator transcription factor [Paraburkholderia atlantica]MBB5509790.1 two-component system capsular synthesis response regulator RcsB [Paraburkholderia atlantica]
MTNKIHVVVADDHDSIRAGVRSLLRDKPNIEIVGEAADTHGLAKLLDACACDVVVSDIGMPGLDGDTSAVPLLRRLLRRTPHPHVVVLTMIGRAHVLAGLRNIGVTGIVDKRDAVDALIDAIEAVAAGGTHLSEQVRAALTAAEPAPPRRGGAMSAREWEVFQLYVRGLAVHEIATRLRRSDKTISTQKRSAMRKLGLETEADLINYATQIGLI